MDVLNLVVDLTRRPANTKAYLDCIDGLTARARQLGLNPNPIFLTLEPGFSPEPFLERRELQNALRLSARTPLATAELASIAVQGAATLVLSCGTVISPDWLSRAWERFGSLSREALVYPELGVFNNHGNLEFVSYADPGRHEAAVSRISQFAPVCLGSGELMKGLLQLGGFVQDIFSRDCWLESWLARGLGRLAPLERSAFFVDHPFVPSLYEGMLFKGLEVKPLPWLREELERLLDVEPRVPLRSMTRLCAPGRPLDQAQEKQIAELDRALPRDLEGLFVLGSVPAPHLRALMRSVARSCSGRELWALVSDAEDILEEQVGSSTIRFIETRRKLEEFGYDARARIILALLSTRSIGFLHLFESHLALELAKAIKASRREPGRLSMTVHSKPGHSAHLEGELSKPETLDKIGDIPVFFFHHGHPAEASMAAYGLCKPASAEPLAPWNWRAGVTGQPVDRAPAPEDYEFAKTFRPYLLPHFESDPMAPEHFFPPCRDSFADLLAPIPCVSLSMRPPESLPEAEFLLCRDGALSLLRFFSKYETPAHAKGPFKGTFLLDESLAPYVPNMWHDRVLLYRLRTRTPCPEQPSRLVLCGLVYPETCLPSSLEENLAALNKRLDLSRATIECHLPILWRDDTNTTFWAEVARAIHKGFPGRPIHWLDEASFSKIEAGPGLAFHEVTPKTLYAFGPHSWQLLSAGVPAIADSKDEAPNPIRIALSPDLWIEAFKVSDASRERTHQLGDLALLPHYAELLERMMQR